MLICKKKTANFCSNYFNSLNYEEQALLQERRDLQRQTQKMGKQAEMLRDHGYCPPENKNYDLSLFLKYSPDIYQIIYRTGMSEPNKHEIAIIDFIHGCMKEEGYHSKVTTGKRTRIAPIKISRFFVFP